MCLIQFMGLTQRQKGRVYKVAGAFFFLQSEPMYQGWVHDKDQCFHPPGLDKAEVQCFLT